MAYHAFWAGRRYGTVYGEDIPAIEGAQGVFGELTDKANALLELTLGAGYDVDESSINAVTIPVPSWDDVSITGALSYWADILDNTLSRLAHIDIPYDPPSDITVPDPPAYDDSLRQTLSTSIVNDLNNGLYGIKNDNELLSFESIRDKANFELEKARMAHVVRFCASGLSSPPGFMNRGISDSVEKYNNDLSEANAKITIDANERFSKAKAMTYESAVDLARVAFDKFSLGLRLMAAVYKARVDAFYQIVKSQSGAASATYDGYLASVSAYAAEMDGLYKSYQAQAGLQEFGFRRYDSEFMAALEEVKATLTALFEEIRLYVAEGDAKTKAYAAMASSALSGIDVNARVGASQGHNESATSSSSASDSADYSGTNSNTVQVQVSSQADGPVGTVSTTLP